MRDSAKNVLVEITDESATIIVDLSEPIGETRSGMGEVYGQAYFHKVEYEGETFVLNALLYKEKSKAERDSLRKDRKVAEARKLLEGEGFEVSSDLDV